MRVIFFSLFLVFAGCGSDNFPKYTQLGGLRVLGIRADLSSSTGQAEFSPGDSVLVTPYISDFGGGGRQLTFTASGCIDPGVGLGAQPSCTGVPGATPLASGNATLANATSYTGAATTFTAQIPSSLFTNQPAQSQYNGVNYLVTYQITAPDGSSVSTFKRLPVSVTTKTKNQNPVLNNIIANGATLSTLPAGPVVISAGFTNASLESYNVMNSDGSLTPSIEQLLVTFFITDGSLDIYRTVNNQGATYTPPGGTPTDHSAIIVEVVRDGRGGEAFYLQKLN